jgi:hypothetical protein
MLINRELIAFALFGAVSISWGATGPEQDSVVIYKTGEILAAKCVDSRSLRGLDVLVEYLDGQVIREYFALPTGINCTESYVNSLEGATVNIMARENIYETIEIAGQLYRDLNNPSERKRWETSGNMFPIIWGGFLFLLIGLRVIRKSINNGNS